MRTIMVLNWDGFTKENYETIRKTVKWETEPPKGLVFHVAGFHNNVMRVTDIWESADDFNNFVKARLMPATIAAGITTEPRVEMFPVHSVHVPSPELVG